MSTLVEFEHVKRDYDMNGTNAIIDSPEHGRLLLADGFGGIDQPSGGAVRWRHGMAVKLQPRDTLASLKGENINEITTQWEQVIHGYDKTRPILPWPGFVIEKMAESLGL